MTTIDGAAKWAARHTTTQKEPPTPIPPTFIDLFAGCGGLSLGLLQAGWRELFAIERSPDAFATLRYNLIDPNPNRPFVPNVDWPAWLPKEPMDISAFIKDYDGRLEALRGHVTLVAGGPPCQGFSFAGQRREDDPRNQLFKRQIKVVTILKPDAVLIENVRGIDIAHDAGGRGGPPAGRQRESYARRIHKALKNAGYEPWQSIVKACDFGVPQLRPRFITVGIRADLLGKYKPDFVEHILKSLQHDFRKEHGLPAEGYVTVSDAISDLRTEGKSLVECDDPSSPRGFRQIEYGGPESPYQCLMHGDLKDGQMDSLRLPNHSPGTISRFKQILARCKKGVTVPKDIRDELSIKKNSIVPLAPDKPSHTLTTLPDDFIHYSEPRVHTVREQARLQSFPDWFAFRGKYTTGGPKRVRECPRYTQVGNAVPPLLAKALGEALKQLIGTLRMVGRDDKSEGGNEDRWETTRKTA